MKKKGYFETFSNSAPLTEEERENLEIPGCRKF